MLLCYYAHMAHEGEFSHVYEAKLQKTVEQVHHTITPSGSVSVRDTAKETIEVAVKTLKGNQATV